MASLLAIDADGSVRRTYRLALAEYGAVAEAESPVQAAALIAQTSPNLIVAEWPADGSGPAAFAMLRQWAPGVPTIAVLTWRTPAEEVLAHEAGAAACLSKPLRIEQLRTVVASLIDEDPQARVPPAPQQPAPQQPAPQQPAPQQPAPQQPAPQQPAPQQPAPLKLDRSPEIAAPATELIATSPSMQSLLDTIENSGSASLTLAGELGTGKRTLALHAAGLAFVQGGGICIDAAQSMQERLRAEVNAALNPASVPPPPIVLFEAQCLPEGMQTRLAEAINEGRRVIATSSATAPSPDLPSLQLQVPPLRERPEDIVPLAVRLLQTLCRQQGVPPKELDLEAADLLAGMSWPGNLRQLEGILSAAVARHPGARVFERTHLSEPQNQPDTPSLEGVVALSLREATRRFERRLITQALEEAAGVQTQAAQKLGTTRRILKYKMNQLGLK